MDTARIALGLSIGAIAFTIFSFWWINARMGRLVIVGPQYVFGRFTTKALEIQLPVVFQNTGAQTIVISGIRLQFLEGKREDLLWIGSSKNPINGDFEFKKPIVVKKFDALESNLYFKRERACNQLGPVRVRIQAIWSGNSCWRTLSTFTLPSSTEGWNDQFSGIDIIGGVATQEKSV